MSVMEANTIDMSAILMQAYEIADLIKCSADVANYLYWKNEVETDPEVQKLAKQFAKKKELFEECQRFGRFHPDYHAAMEEALRLQNELDKLEPVRNFKLAERNLDQLLHEVSVTIAHAVSDKILVPGNDETPVGGCGAGGRCGCSGCG